MGLSPILIDSVIYGSLYAFMSLGLTLSYMTSKVPNFAHGSFVTLGAYTGYSMLRFAGLDPYASMPLTFLIGGASALVMYLFVLRLLTKRGADSITLMVSTFAVTVAFTGIFGAYADYLSEVWKFPDSRFFLLASHDFTVFGVGAVDVVAPASLVILTTFLFIFLTRTKFGVAMRATVNNSSLAEILGVNVQAVYSVSWFLAGGLAALAGSLFSLAYTAGPNLGTDFTVAFFAASLLGGLTSIYGAILGGVITGMGQILISNYVAQEVGPWFLAYEPAVPMVIMIVGLVLIPEGIMSLNFYGIWRRLRRAP
jgi:branched-chain amino acid transport system permease protein